MLSRKEHEKCKPNFPTAAGGGGGGQKLTYFFN